MGYEICPACNGTKAFECYCILKGKANPLCNNCKGKGKVNCKRCHGKGKVFISKR